MSRVISEAERAEALYNWADTTEAARRLGGVDPGQVRAWIKAGELMAWNVAGPGAKRREYRFSEEALAAFEAKRIVNPDAGRIPDHIVRAAVAQHERDKRRGYGRP